MGLKLGNNEIVKALQEFLYLLVTIHGLQNFFTKINFLDFLYSFTDPNTCSLPHLHQDDRMRTSLGQ